MLGFTEYDCPERPCICQHWLDSYFAQITFSHIYKLTTRLTFVILSLLPFVQLFSQFDADGEGFADVETFLEVCIVFGKIINRKKMKSKWKVSNHCQLLMVQLSSNTDMLIWLIDFPLFSFRPCKQLVVESVLKEI